MKYRYIGKEAIVLTGIGIVYPNMVVKGKVNHPLFIEEKVEAVTKKKKHYK